MNNSISAGAKAFREIREFLFYSMLSVVVMLLLTYASVSAQGDQVQVSYDVQFFTTGAMLRGPDCPAAAGFDKLTGTIMGFEPAPRNENITYEGVLTRDTDISLCSVATDPSHPDQHRPCVLHVTGKAEAWFELELDTSADNSGRFRGGYLKWINTKPVKVFSSSVTGDCDAEETAELQRDYRNMSTGASPDGQFINVQAMPRIVSARNQPEFAPPANGVNGRDGLSAGDRVLWTMKVTGRRP